MDNDFFKHTIDYVLYALKKIMVANDNKNYYLVDKITRQEIAALKEDLKLLEEGDKK